MNTFNLLENVTAVDVVAFFTFCIVAIPVLLYELWFSYIIHGYSSDILFRDKLYS
jgi:hypothetical protein